MPDVAFFFALLWVMPAAAILAGFVWVARAQRARSVLRNAWGVAVFAAGLVLGVLYFTGWHQKGPGSPLPHEGWQWRIPLFALTAAAFAAVAGWASTVLWLALRQVTRPHKLLPPGPRRREIVLAIALLVVLAFAYLAGMTYLAAMVQGGKPPHVQPPDDAAAGG